MFVALALTYFVSCEDDDNKYPLLGEEPRSIAEIVSSNPELSTLNEALVRLELDVVLNETTTYTLLAPSNSAFSGIDIAAMSDAELEALISGHVILTTTADFSKSFSGYVETTATYGPDDTSLNIYANNSTSLQINGEATVVEGMFNIGATNGVIHIIDAVIMPPTFLDLIASNAEFSSLAQAVEITDLGDALNSASVKTLFAPNNAAFEAFLADVNGTFGWATLSDVPVDVLTEILMYHVVEGNNLDGDLDGSTFETLQSESFSIAGTVIDDASYTDANVTEIINVQGYNGVAHAIDKVLLTDGVFQSMLGATLNLAERAEDRGFTTFLEAAAMVDLSVDLTSDELTVFAPNNDAFVGLFATINNFESLEDFDTPEELETLKSLLEYHLLTGTTLLGDLTDGGTVTSIYGDDITANLSGDEPRLEPSFEEAISSIILANNIGASNGVIHEINRVLVPTDLTSALGIELSSGGVHPITNTDWVFFDWDANGPWWGNVAAENEAALSLDGSSYGRANFQTGGTGWQDLFWRNDPTTFNGAAEIGANIDDYSLKFDINVIEPLTAGAFRIRFRDADGVDAFYDWQPWVDSGEPFTTDGWMTVEIPLAVLGVPDFSLVDAEFGMAFEGANVLLNFAIDNVRFDTPGNGGPEEIEDEALVFFDWEDNGAWWGNVAAENDAALSLDGEAYGRANFQTGGTGWQDLFWRNDPTTFHGAATVGADVANYSLKFDINVIEPLTAGAFRIRFNDADGVDAFYDWQPWVDSGEPYTTDGWETVTIPCSVLGVPDFSLVDAEFGMAFEGADVLLNFAIDNVRFDAN